jgi:Fusaric acid resistance protein family
LLLLPSNPQNYDPQFFLTNGTLNVVSIILLVITVAVLLPTTDDCRRSWLLRSLRRDFRQAHAEKRLSYDLDEVAFRDADRECQIESLQQPYLSEDGPDVHSMLHRSELTSAAWSMRLALQQLQQDPEADEEGRAALAAADPIRLFALANRLWARREATVEEEFERCSWAAALSARMAILIEHSPNEVAALRAGF